MSAPHLCIPVGVVIERVRAESPWTEFIWRPLQVLPGLPEAAPWTELEANAERACIYAGVAEIALHASTTAHYLSNLQSGAPALWVVLRPTALEPPYSLVAVTADPTEGESYVAAGDNLVDVVPMPPLVRETIEHFVAEHHVEQPFFKRKRDRADPDAMARRAPGRSERSR